MPRTSQSASKLASGYLLLLMSTSCEKSTFGPVMVKPEQSSQASDDQSSGTSTSEAPSCSANPKRVVFYGNSSVSQKFSCNQNVSSLALTSGPSFITGAPNGTAITFTGTAPASSLDQMWSFSINNITGTSFSVTTTVLDPSSLTSTLSPPSSFDATNGNATSNNADFNLGHTMTLDSKWDGLITDASLSATAITTDIPGMAFYDSCSSATAPYVCNGTVTTSGFTVTNPLTMRWRWSVFDQGTYYLDVQPKSTIEGGNTTLATNTFTATIPIQSSGSVQVTAANNPDNTNSYDAQRYRYGVAISPLSTALNPIVGLVYTDRGVGIREYFQRISIDRTALPGGGSSGLTENGSPLEQTNANSQDFSVNQLADGSWAVVGGAATTGSFDVLFNKIADSTSSPSISGSSHLLTSFSNTTERALEISTTKPFDDNGTTRMGLAFVRKDTTTSQSYLTVAKINPAGTSLNTILDDTNYGTTNTGGYTRFQLPSTTDGVDRVRIKWISESGTGYFYVAYRQNTDLKVLRLRSQYSSGHGETTATVTSAAFANSDTSGSNQQSLDLAVGTVSGATVAAIVYRDSAGDCYFRRVDSSLTPSAALKFGTAPCYNPSVHFAASGRFVATYAERQTSPSTKYDIKTTEFTLGNTDSNSTPVTVVADLTSYPIRLVTDLYSSGNWMAVFYRLYSNRYLKFHGYHVPGR